METECVQCKYFIKHYVMLEDLRYKESSFGHCLIYKRLKKDCARKQPKPASPDNEKERVAIRLENLIHKIEELYAYINSK